MDQQALKKLIDSAPALVATRYFTRFVVLLWDHLLTFGDEVKYIWKRPVEFSKAVFLFNRYFVEGALCLSVYLFLELRGPLSQESSGDVGHCGHLSALARCHDYILFIGSTSVVSITIANSMVTFHIQSIWDKQRAVSYALLAGFCVTYGITMVCAGITVNDFQSQIIWVPLVNSCVVPHKPMSLIGVWAGMVAFDVFVLVMLFANAVNRPYRENSEVLDTLGRDGIKFLIVLLAMRFINLMLTIFSAPGEVLVIIFFLWAIVSVTLSRFLLMVKASEKKTVPQASLPLTTMSANLWRSSSGHWSRKSDLIELKPTQ